MKITFILPSASPNPVGGYKVVFEYANHLSDRGHQVNIVLPALEEDPHGAPLSRRLIHTARWAVRSLLHGYGPENWFTFRPQVRVIWIPSFSERNIPDSDAVIATGWPTAECVAQYSPSKGERFYFIQAYEDWFGPQPREQRMLATWKLPLRKIIIARWLCDIAARLGESFAHIPNGLDFARFGCDVPIEDRTAPTVAMMYHELPLKGSADGLQALQLAKQSVPDLKATLFGVYAPPANLPSWITYVRNPPQRQLREIYNEATVFLSPSWSEGWPLPPAEAMMSGAALVCTEIGGHQEYAVHENNALLAPSRMPEALSAALVRMLTNQPLRQSLAQTALLDMSRFTWTTAAERFETVLASRSR